MKFCFSPSLSLDEDNVALEPSFPPALSLDENDVVDVLGDVDLGQHCGDDEQGRLC